MCYNYIGDKMKLDNLIIAHRGMFNNINIPENSILAFKKAIKYNYPIELDVQLTKDNILIVFHDDNLKRMTGYDKNVCEVTYDEIKNLNLLETKQTIPTLKDVLKLIDNKVLLDIEIKSTNKIKDICKILLNELKDYNNYIIKSFNPKIVRHIYKLNPNITKGLLISKKYYNTLIGRIILYYCKPNFLAFSTKYINKYKFKKPYKKHSIMLWTIKNKNEMNKYKNITNNYICNNLPY